MEDATGGQSVGQKGHDSPAYRPENRPKEVKDLGESFDPGVGWGALRTDGLSSAQFLV